MVLACQHGHGVGRDRLRVGWPFLSVIDSGGEVPREEEMLYSGTDPESYITEYTLVYKEKQLGHV